nr:protein yippee-like At5g53940 [Ipomoea batatas]
MARVLAGGVLSVEPQDRNGAGLLYEVVVVNVTVGPPEERPMISGMHTESAHDDSQKYKEGKFILERGGIIDRMDSEFYIDTRTSTSDTEDA